MNLVIPTPGEDPGPDYATNNSNSLTIIDGHNHSNGSGVSINPAGLNINSDLTMNGNNLTAINTTRYNNLTASLAGTSPNISCVYVAANELYFNDPVGNVVKMTLAGSVNATSSGISSGTASASFNGGVLVVNSNTNTPGDIQAGSILIGNNVASSNFAKLKAPNSLAANYDLVLPPTNSLGSTAFVTIDTSNNMGDSVAYPLQGADIANLTIDTANLANSAVTTAKINNGAVTFAKTAAANIVISSSSGGYSTASAGYTTVTNLSSSITTSGRPVYVTFQSDGTNTNAILAMSSGGTGNWQVLRNSTVIAGPYPCFSPTVTGGIFSMPPGCLNCVDVPSSGTYTYSLQANAAVGTNFVNNVVMVVREF